jgi:hypothetical protein
MKLKLTILGLTLLIFSSMNIYSRALRHISIKDVKQKHQEKIVEKIQEEVRKKEERQYIQSVMETKKYDWRKELNEQMTTSDVFFTTLPATGDVNLEFPNFNTFVNVSSSVSGSTLVITNSGVEGSGGATNGVGAYFDTSFYDTLVFNVSISGNSALLIEPYSLFYASSGTKSVNVSQSSSLQLFFLSPALSNGTVTISNLRLQRRTPLNVFVSLDSPEATSFIRTGSIMSNLSPAERLQKLKELLASGDEYVGKILGADFPGTGAVPPGEYDPFKQAPAGEAGDTPGVEISQAYPTPPSYVRDSIMRQYGKPGYGKFTPEDQKNILNWQQKIRQSSTGSQDTQIAAEPLRGQKTDVRYDPKMKMFVPRPSGEDSGQNVLDLLRLAAHYEPQGELISEKKLKSPEEVLNKIPGYYDGKPAPLGFPETPPPEMVNGMHPDLVDGKKTMETKKYDWRKELNEQMTTSDVFFTNLPATGDVNLAFPDWPIAGGSGYSVSGGTVTISATEQSQGGFVASFDSSIYTTVVFDVIAGGNAVLGVFGSGQDPLSVITSSGTYSFTSRSLLFTLAPGSGSTQIRNLRYQRRTPMNVFVSLDSPEATSFIRTDPMMSKLSPAERKKKLREMLASGDEYVEKMLGANFPGSGAVPPGEYDPFKQAPAGEAGDTPGVKISNFDTSKMEKDYGQIAGFDATYEMIKSGQVPFMKPPAARQLLLNPKYQKLWDDDPGALKTIQRLAV